MSTMMHRAAPNELLTPTQYRVYKNEGNAPLIAQLDDNVREILDVGCGAGDNAALIRSRLPGCRIHGITKSVAEFEIAKHRMTSSSVRRISRVIFLRNSSP